jgi:hypothetical protein
VSRLWSLWFTKDRAYRDVLITSLIVTNEEKAKLLSQADRSTMLEILVLNKVIMKSGVW